MHKRAKIWFGLAGLLSAVLAVVMWQPGARRGGGTGGSRSSLQDPVATHHARAYRDTADGARTELGQALHYQVQMKTITERSNAGGPLSMTVDLELAWTRIQESAEGSLHRGTLSNVVFRVERNGAPLDAPIEPEMKTDLGQAFFVETAVDGRVGGVHVQPGSHPLVNGIRRALAANLQRVDAEQPGAERWEAIEADPLGEVVAAYTRHGAQQLNKQKLRYQTLTLGAGSADLADTVAIESKIRYDLGADGVVEGYRNDETLEIGGLAEPIDMRAEISMRLVKVTASDLDPVDLGALQFLSLYAIEASAPPSAAALREAAGDVRVPELLAELADETLSEDRRWEIHDRLTAWFRVEPTSVDEARTTLLKSEKLDRHASMMLASLSDTDTRETQLALLELGEAASNEDVRRAALQHLVLTEKPSVDTLAGLRDLLDAQSVAPETRAGAMLAYGSAAGEASRSLDPMLRQAGEADVAALLGGLQGASTPDEEAIHLSALGNSASTQATTPLVQRFRDGSEMQRVQALDAMRLIPDPQVDQALQGSLLDDPSSRVRDAAARTANYRPYTPELERTLIEALADEDDETVRRELLSVLGKHAQQSQAAAERLRFAAESDASEDVRKHARGLLGLAPEPDTAGG